MDILVLGGTRFVGRHFVEAALAGGHRLTLFHRGATRPQPLEGVEEVHGDRERDLGLLASRRWDVVVDTCGYVPRIVGLSVDALHGRVDRYVFVSTISVYADQETSMQTEDAPLQRLEDPSVEEVNGETYGGLKVLCEERVQTSFGERSVIVRPGLVVGPHDHTDRFTYWPLRFSHPGEFLVPEVPECPVQFVDGRDLARFMVRLIEEGTSGVYHVCGPTPALRLRDFVHRGVGAFGGVALPVWVPPQRLEEQGVQPWQDLPMVGSFDGTGGGLMRLDNRRSIAAGLELRSLEETLRDTAAWWNAERAKATPKVGLTTEREQELLKELAPST